MGNAYYAFLSTIYPKAGQDTHDSQPSITLRRTSHVSINPFHMLSQLRGNASSRSQMRLKRGQEIGHREKYCANVQVGSGRKGGVNDRSK